MITQVSGSANALSKRRMHEHAATSESDLVPGADLVLSA